MGSAIGWYGPLVDLSNSASHIGDFVQLLVFVHRSLPRQCKSLKGGDDAIGTDIRVGDDTRPYFAVSIWKKHMACSISPGDVILLQNLKIARSGDFVEARTVHCSSLQILIHPYQLLVSQGMEDLISNCRAGIVTKDKLRKVVKWVRQAGFSLIVNDPKLNCDQLDNPYAQEKTCLLRNWKVPEEIPCRECSSLSEVSQIKDPCRAIVCAYTGEILQRFNSRTLADTETGNMLISRRLEEIDDSLIEEFICAGCQLCGSPMDSKYEGKIFRLQNNRATHSCSKSSNRVHAVGFIYRPFVLNIWDELKCIPIVVNNKAAEILFGNIKADKVYLCYRRQIQKQKLGTRFDYMANVLEPRVSDAVSRGVQGLSAVYNSSEGNKAQCCVVDMNFCLIWSIILKLLLQQEQNSPLKFEIMINPSSNDSGKFEMISASMPCSRMK